MISDTCYDQWCYDSIIYRIHIYNYYKHWSFKEMKKCNKEAVWKTKWRFKSNYSNQNRGRNIEQRKKPLWSIQTRKLNKFWNNLKKKENYKLYLSYKSFRKTTRKKLMLGYGPGFELTTCDLWFKSQIQSFTNKYFSRN